MGKIKPMGTQIPSHQFSIPQIIEEIEMKLITNLMKNKATGLDGLSAIPVLTKTVTNILNLFNWPFPSLWKLGNVTPVHKCGNRSHRNSF